MSDTDSILGALTTIANATVGVDNNRIDHGLRLNVAAHNDDGQRVRYEIEIPAKHVPAFMTAVATHGSNILTDIADSWRRGDCPTCNNVRMVQVERPGRGAWSEHCPDCNLDGSALTGYPVPHREGEPSRQGQP